MSISKRGIVPIAACLCLTATSVDARTGEPDNVGLDVTNAFALTAAGAGRRMIAFFVDESRQGGTDLNGDGDTADRVLHVLDRRTGEVVNQALALPFFGTFQIERDLLAFSVEERAQGGTDLNGDGDALDQVLHVYDHRTGEVVNVGLDRAGGTLLHGARLAVGVRESAQGDTDLNGDGDALDVVLHIYDVRRATLTNVMLDASGSFRMGDRHVAFSVAEASQGGADLNGDGDATDRILHTYDIRRGVTRNHRLDTRGSFLLAGHRIAVSVFETTGIPTDFNLDGDTLDRVLHVVNLRTGSVTNTMLNTNGGFRVDGRRIAVGVSELSQGAVDLNGDGDTLDRVLHVHDMQRDESTNLMLATSFGYQVDDGRVAFAVPEPGQGETDLNDNGRIGDSVLHVHDMRSGRTTNVGYAVDSVGFVLDGRDVAFGASEFAQGAVDLNGDGDVGDTVLHHYDARRREVGNAGISMIGRYVLEDRRILAGVVERFQGDTDLNGDGDTRDFVVHLVDIRRGRVTNLELAARFDFLLSERAVLAGVSERDQGEADLNADGDTADSVLHVVDPRRRHRRDDDKDDDRDD